MPKLIKKSTLQRSPQPNYRNSAKLLKKKFASSLSITASLLVQCASLTSPKLLLLIWKLMLKARKSWFHSPHHCMCLDEWMIIIMCSLRLVLATLLRKTLPRHWSIAIGSQDRFRRVVAKLPKSFSTKNFKCKRFKTNLTKESKQCKQWQQKPKSAPNENNLLI